jgi:peptide deformylase
MIKPLVELSVEKFHSKDVSLRVPSREVVQFDETFRQLVTDLVDTLKAHKIAIGLAAPQIGVNSRVAVINLSNDKIEPTFVFANPRNLIISGKKDKKKESCMSLPRFRGLVERRDKIEFTYEDDEGHTRQIKATGFLARALCHEIDHLDGVLYVDRMPNPRQLEAVDFFEKD